ncbi:MAG: ABC transporter permease [Actinobacteria bacterium]|mgnify:FL=1|nr:MAG: ABC transporter permease [Actinomycetota bacterium]
MTSLADKPALVRAPAEVRRARIRGIVYFVLAVATYVLLASTTEGDVVFRLGDAPGDLDLTLSAAGLATASAVVFGFLGALEIGRRGLGRWSNIALSIALALFAFAFLGWAAAGKSLSLVGMLEGSVAAATPIAFGALSGVMCERVAVINIGIEGMLLTGAFMGAVIGTVVNPVGGVVAATLAGGVMAAILAVLAIKYRVDQIIAGVVINILALGLTSFLSAQILVENSSAYNNPGVLRPIKIPVLGDIPIIGRIFFDQNIFIYALFIITAGMTYGLFRTRWGLRSRAVGEHPKAADTLGINVFRTRYMNVIIGGMIAGFGGAYFTLGSVGAFNENMTAGRGFIGLAAMIFGRWHPVGALAAALVFGFADSLQVKLAILDSGIPSEFLLMAPYLVTIIVVAGVVGAARPPAADGQPYIKE